MDILKIVKKNIIKRREELGLLKKEAAFKCGMTRQTYEWVESSKKPGMTLSTLEKVSKGLKIDISELIRE